MHVWNDHYAFVTRCKVKGLSKKNFQQLGSGTNTHNILSIGFEGVS